MFEKSNKKIKQKIVASFILASFLFSNFLPLKNTYAMPSTVVLDLGFVMQNILDGIKEVGWGIMKSTLSTTLNNFAQQLALYTVEQVATGGNGQTPLTFQFPLGDMLKKIEEAATGEFLDRISEEVKYNVCKPLDLSKTNISWFKLTLDIVPEVRQNQTEQRAYTCTLSKFVEAVDKSFEEITNVVQRAFAVDCFEKFEPKSVLSLKDSYKSNTGGLDLSTISNSLSLVDSAAEVVGDVGSVLNFTYQGFKDYYLYDVSSFALSDRVKSDRSYFSKKSTYYKQNSVNSKCLSYSGQASDWCTLSEYPDAKKSCQTKTSLNPLNIEGGAVVNKDGVNNISFSNDSEDCIKIESSEVKNGKFVADASKQKDFLNSYKNCYVPKVKDTFKSFVQLGTVPKQDIEERLVSDGCRTLTEKLFNGSAASLYKKYMGINDPNMLEGEDYKKVLQSILISDRSTNGMIADAYDIKNHILMSGFNFFGDVEQYIIDCNGDNNVSSCYGRVEDSNGDGKITKDDASISFTGDSVKSSMIYKNSVVSDDYFYKYESNGQKTISFKKDLLSTLYINYTESNNGPINSTIYNSVKEGVINTCISTAKANKPRLALLEQRNTDAWIKEQQIIKTKGISLETDLFKTEYSRSDTRAVTEPISGEIKTPSSVVGNKLESALNPNESGIQATGDIVVDAVNIFLATLLKEGSAKAMEGLFSRMFATDDVVEDLSTLDGLKTDGIVVTDDADSNGNIEAEDTVCRYTGTAKEGEFCTGHCQCVTGYCELRAGAYVLVGSVSGSGSIEKPALNTCQKSESSVKIK